MLFSEGMKAMRLQLDLTQQQLSEICGVSQSTISAIECGSRSPTEETMQMIAKGLNTTVGALLGDTQKAPADGISERDMEMITLASSLSPSEFQRVKDFVSGLKAARIARPSHDQ